MIHNFDERFEIRTRKMLSPCLVGENTPDGEVIFYVVDLPHLINSIMEFVENEHKKRGQGSN
mgnify:CR=1 FL=1